MSTIVHFFFHSFRHTHTHTLSLLFRKDIFRDPNVPNSHLQLNINTSVYNMAVLAKNEDEEAKEVGRGERERGRGARERER